MAPAHRGQSRVSGGSARRWARSWPAGLEQTQTWDIEIRMRTKIAIRTLCVLGLLAGCGPKQGEKPAPSPQPTGAADAGAANDCSVDADCVPASCCHPSSCVPAAQQPDCTGVACTMECQAGTMDCGGRCACEAGSCTAILGQP